MLEYDRIGVSQGIGVNKTAGLKCNENFWFKRKKANHCKNIKSLVFYVYIKDIW